MPRIGIKGGEDFANIPHNDNIAAAQVVETVVLAAIAVHRPLPIASKGGMGLSNYRSLCFSSTFSTTATPIP